MSSTRVYTMPSVQPIHTEPVRKQSKRSRIPLSLGENRHDDEHDCFKHKPSNALGKAKTLCAQAFGLLKKGDVMQALTLFSESYQIIKDLGVDSSVLVEPLKGLIHIYKLLHMESQWLTTMDELIMLKPSSADLMECYVELGLYYKRKKQYDLGIKMFDCALSLSGFDNIFSEHLLWLELASFYREAGMAHDGLYRVLDAIKRVGMEESSLLPLLIELDQTFTSIEQTKRTVLSPQIILVKEKLRLLTPICARLMESTTNDVNEKLIEASHFRGLAEAMANAGWITQAIIVIRQALLRNENDPVALYCLGVWNELIGAKSLARSYLLLSLKHDDSNIATMQALARCSVGNSYDPLVTSKQKTIKGQDHGVFEDVSNFNIGCVYQNDTFSWSSSGIDHVDSKLPSSSPPKPAETWPSPSSSSPTLWVPPPQPRPKSSPKASSTKWPLPANSFEDSTWAQSSLNQTWPATTQTSTWLPSSSTPPSWSIPPPTSADRQISSPSQTTWRNSSVSSSSASDHPSIFPLSQVRSNARPVSLSTACLAAVHENNSNDGVVPSSVWPEIPMQSTPVRFQPSLVKFQRTLVQHRKPRDSSKQKQAKQLPKAEALSFDFELPSLLPSTEIQMEPLVLKDDLLPKAKESMMTVLPEPTLTETSSPNPISVTYIHISSMETINVHELEQRCLDSIISLISGLPDAVSMNLSKFSTNTLLQRHANDRVDVLQQNYREFVSENPMSWEYKFYRKHMELRTFAKYQDSMRELNEIPNVVEFCTNVDLQDEQKWQEQLDEIAKLPSFLQVNSKLDLLSCYPFPILGMNRAQMYLKAQGCRTTGHQENHNFCSINLNTGPGDCEWFAVEFKYWVDINTLCTRHGVDFLKGSWWPNVADLEAEGIPYARFVQKPGEIVFVSYGTVHWVQALGVTNNIAWNYGPRNAKQYRMAVDRYFWNKKEVYKSIVPMKTLSWYLANQSNLEDKEMVLQIRKTLKELINQEYKQAERLEKKKVAVNEFNAPEWGVFYCCKCEIEVFNHLFLIDPGKGKEIRDVFCEECCARASTKKNVRVCRRYPLATLDETLAHLEAMLAN